MSCPDNYDRWKSHQAAQDRAEANLPVCDECYETIHDEAYYEIDGIIYCDACMDGHRKWVEV